MTGGTRREGRVTEGTRKAGRMMSVIYRLLIRKVQNAMPLTSDARHLCCEARTAPCRIPQ